MKCIITARRRGLQTSMIIIRRTGLLICFRRRTCGELESFLPSFLSILTFMGTFNFHTVSMRLTNIFPCILFSSRWLTSRLRRHLYFTFSFCRRNHLLNDILAKPSGTIDFASPTFPFFRRGSDRPLPPLYTPFSVLHLLCIYI